MRWAKALPKSGLIAGTMLGVLAVLVMVIMVFNRNAVQAQDDLSSQIYAKIEQFRTYGSQKALIESRLNSELGPETAIREIWATRDELGKVNSFTVRISDTSGLPWYTMSSEDGESFGIQYHRSGEGESGLAVTGNSVGSDTPAEDWVATFRQLGWRLVASDSSSATFEITEVLSEEGKKRLTPAEKDLNPTAIRHHALVDTARNVVTESYRYAIAKDGEETLVEYFKVLELEDSY
jgi:hypothetical protein